MNRLVKKTVIAAAIISLAFVAEANLSAASAAPVDGGISVRPLHPGVTTPTYFTLSAKPGTTLNDAIVIENKSSASVNLQVSPVDGLTGQTSGAVYANRQDKITKAGAWVTPEVSNITLAGGASRIVTFVVKVPVDATIGDHLAGIGVENTVPTTSTKGFAVKQILRSVIGVRVIVPGPAKFVPHLSSLKIAAIGSTNIGAVDVGLSNTGTQLEHPTLTVAMTGPDGYAKSQKRVLDTVLPGDSIVYPFNWADKLAKGNYDILATFTGGGKTVTLSSTFELGKALAGVIQPLPVVTQAKSSNLWQIIVAALVAAILVGLLTAFFIRRSHRNESRTI